jgi:hypothetical protein
MLEKKICWQVVRFYIYFSSNPIKKQNFMKQMDFPLRLAAACAIALGARRGKPARLGQDTSLTSSRTKRPTACPTQKDNRPQKSPALILAKFLLCPSCYRRAEFQKKH